MIAFRPQEQHRTPVRGDDGGAWSIALLAHAADRDASPQCKRNPAARIMLALLAEMASSEVEVLRERILSGLAEAKRKGVTLGRPKGAKLNRNDFLQKHRDIQKQLKAGQSVRNTAAITWKGASTVQRVKAMLAEAQAI